MYLGCYWLSGPKPLPYIVYLLFKFLGSDVDNGINSALLNIDNPPTIS